MVAGALGDFGTTGDLGDARGLRLTSGAVLTGKGAVEVAPAGDLAWSAGAAVAA